MGDFDLEIGTGGGILINLELCKGWKNIIQECKISDNYKKRLEDDANDLAQFSGLQKARLNWNDEWGLNFVEAHYGNACALLLNKDENSPSYYPHNIDTPEQAFVLMSTVLTYVFDVRSTYHQTKDIKEYPINWAIKEISLGPKDSPNREIIIKINLHPRLEEIIRCARGMNNESFRKYLENSAPFTKEGYSGLKEIRFNWDDTQGLRSVEAIPGINGSALYLENPINNYGCWYYRDHNLSKPIQAVALIGVVSKYMQYLKPHEKELDKSGGVKR